MHVTELAVGSLCKWIKFCGARRAAITEIQEEGGQQEARPQPASDPLEDYLSLSSMTERYPKYDKRRKQGRHPGPVSDAPSHPPEKEASAPGSQASMVITPFFVAP